MARLKSMLWIAAAAMICGSAAHAQTPPQPGEDGPAITVEAPRSAPAEVGRSAYTGAAVAVTTVRMPVLYGDLDLAKPKEAERLMARIGNVARDLCRELDRLHPLNPDAECASRAVAMATPAARAAIASADAR